MVNRLRQILDMLNLILQFFHTKYLTKLKQHTHTGYILRNAVLLPYFFVGFSILHRDYKKKVI